MGDFSRRNTEKLRKYCERYGMSAERVKELMTQESAPPPYDVPPSVRGCVPGVAWQAELDKVSIDFETDSLRGQRTLTGRIPSVPPLQAFPFYHVRGCETGRIKQESPMQYTGDRCCIAAGTNIIFEGTEAECRAHAKKVLDPQHLGYEQLSIYAPLAVVSRKSEVVLDFREISKVKK